MRRKCQAASAPLGPNGKLLPLVWSFLPRIQPSSPACRNFSDEPQSHQILPMGSETVESPIGDGPEATTDQIGAKDQIQDHAEVIDEAAEEEARERSRREREARAQALTLEIVGDLPYAEVKPPENVLFVCKLNPVTEGWSKSARLEVQH